MLQYCKFKLLLYKELHDYLVALMLHSVAINATIKTQCTGQGTEKYGTGTLMMIRESREHSLPEPSFGGNQPGEFGTTVWRDWLTEEVMAELGLNERQRAALVKAKSAGSIGNMQYREAFGVSESTALRELRHLAKIGALEKVGGTGRSAHYSAAKAKPVINPSNPSLTAKMGTRHKPIKPVVGGSGKPQK